MSDTEKSAKRMVSVRLDRKTSDALNNYIKSLEGRIPGTAGYIKTSAVLRRIINVGIKTLISNEKKRQQGKVC